MKILFLDLGTKTGWATNIHDRIEHGVQTFDLRRGDSPGMRYVRFNSWMRINWSTGCGGMDVICYEQTHQRGGAATEVAAGFATRVQEFCAERKIQHAAVHSGTLKKFWTGKGNANKDEMIEEAKKRGYEVIDDNDADAIAGLYWAMEELITLVNLSE